MILGISLTKAKTSLTHRGAVALEHQQQKSKRKKIEDHLIGTAVSAAAAFKWTAFFILLSLSLLSAGLDLIQQRLGTATTGHHAHLSQSVGDEEEEEVLAALL